SAPTHDSDLKRYADKKFTSKDQRNQNMADAFYQGGHSQTAIALAFGVSSSTVSRIVMGYGKGI
ncbi:MAG: helix-turn-helix domain-containing protein, partial [Polaromonas sp.]|uniref:helix-turn-helix domain-containing protein n=1 Tax=Polaromonas sp. TaxID=1869339 RepID=UPI002730A168